MNLVDQLEKLQMVRSDSMQFDDLTSFEKWSDEVQPLVSFSQSHNRRFGQAVLRAKSTFRLGSEVDALTNMNEAIGVLNQAIVTAKIEATNNKQAAPEREQKKRENKSVKEQFENHPVVFGGSLLLAGLLSGIGLMKFMFPPETKQLVTHPILQPVNIECNIEGLPLVSKAHNKRVSSIQSQILILETQASDRTITYSYQQDYLNSANRLRSDIETENNFFNKATEKLQAKCQKEMYNKQNKSDA